MHRRTFLFSLVVLTLLLGLLATRQTTYADEPLATLSKYVPTDGRIVDGFGWRGVDMDLYESEFPTTLPYSPQMMYSFENYELRGWGPFDNFLSKYSNKVAHLSLQFDDRDDEITSGAHDALLTEFGNKFLGMNRPLYMRLGLEVNGGWFNYDVEYFIEAFRYMVDFWDNMGVTNIAYIWNVHITDAPLDYMLWYPGDNYVQWWSHEVLGPESDPNWNHESPSVLQSRAFCEDAVSRGLPIAIPECSAWFTGVHNGQQSWDDWFDGFFNHVNNANYGVKAYWHNPHNWPEIREDRVDARPSEDPVVKANWQAEMNESQYLHETTPLNLAVIGWPLETTPPGDVQNLDYTEGAGQVSISWTNPSDADLKGIKILRKVGAYPSGPRDTSAVQVHNGPTSVTQVTDSGLTGGVTYYYGVYAYDPVRNYASGVYFSATPTGAAGWLEDFEGDISDWSMSGLWHRVDDSDPYGDSHSPTHSCWYGQDATGDYDTGSRTQGNLTSPGVSVGADAELKFWHWFETESYAGSYDQCIVQVSDDGGQSWDQIVMWDSQDPNITVWTEEVFDLSSYEGESVQVRFRFDSVDGSYNDYRGWYVDDVEVTAAGPDTTPPGEVTNFTADPGDEEVSLSWTNPTDPDFAGVVIRRKEGSYPADETDGYLVYDGTGESTLDTGLTNGVTYYYGAFTYDEVPNYSDGAFASATPQAPQDWYDDMEGTMSDWGFTGLWHQVDDSDPYGDSHSPTHSCWYGQAATGDYNTGARTQGNLTTPEITLASGSELKFWHWFETESYAGSYDQCIVQITDDGGSSWDQLAMWDSQDPNITSWTEQVISLSAYSGKTVQVRFRFDSVDEMYNDYRGWYVDDVTLTNVTP